MHWATSSRFIGSDIQTAAIDFRCCSWGGFILRHPFSPPHAYTQPALSQTGCAAEMYQLYFSDPLYQHSCVRCLCKHSVDPLWGRVLMGGEGSGERWREYGHIHVTLYSCCFTSCMQGREFDNREREKKKKKKSSQTALPHLVSHISKILVGPWNTFYSTDRVGCFKVEWSGTTVCAY